MKKVKIVFIEWKVKTIKKLYENMDNQKKWRKNTTKIIIDKIYKDIKIIKELKEWLIITT